MNLGGLTDSVASVVSDLEKCPHCGSASRVGHGLCVSCLLRSGLSADEPAIDSLDAIFAEVEVRDTDWKLGNYQILGEIGRGGMGVIYRARQKHSRRIVAIKRVLSYHGDSHETLARFQREAEAAASLDHPNILPIYDVGVSDGLPFFSMKFATGGSLLEFKPALRGDPRRSVALMAKVARAVAYAHEHGILHRDLKPGNILLDGLGEPLVSDFGLAKWLDATSNLTRTLTIFGTPGYIAPEQARGQPQDAVLEPAADIYSLGAILFDLFTGRPPFLGEHALAVIKQAEEKTAPKLRSLVPKLDRDLETICARCLERDVAARYKSAGDLAEDLDRWLDRRPIMARPVSVPVRLWSWSRRNPMLASAAVGVVLLGAIATVGQIEQTHLSRTLDEQSMARRSVTVLPFLDLATASSNIELAKSFQESLVPSISALKPARVRTASTHLARVAGLGARDEMRDIAQNASTRTVLTGTSRVVGKKLRVSLRLIDVTQGNVLLQRVVDLDAAQPPAPQLSRLIAGDLSGALDWYENPKKDDLDPALRNSVASDFIRAGQELENRRAGVDLDRAIDCYEKALRIEPTSAVVRAKLVLAMVGSSHLGRPSTELLARAERFGREAVQLNPKLAEAHRALGSLYSEKGDFSAALEQALEAIELKGLEEPPAHFLGRISKMIGRPDMALRWYWIGKHWQTHPADHEFILGDCWCDLADDSRAEPFYKRVADLHPELPEGWLGMCRIRLLQGDFSAARNICRENANAYRDFAFANEIAAQVEFFSRNNAEAERLYAELEKSDPGGGGSFFGAISYQSALGRLRCVTGDENSGRAILSRSLKIEREALAQGPQHPEKLYRTAAIEASLGEKDSALQHLQAASSAGWLDYRSLKLDPRFDPIRDEPRYSQIFEAMVKRVTALRQSKLAEINDWKN